MVRLARLVFRDGGDNQSLDDGLILGALTKQGRPFFKPGHVYEIVETMGVLSVRECGPSWVKPSCLSGRMAKDDFGNEFEIRNHVCWSNSAEFIMTGGGKELFLTEEEFLDLCKQESTNEK